MFLTRNLDYINHKLSIHISNEKLIKYSSLLSKRSLKSSGLTLHLNKTLELIYIQNKRFLLNISAFITSISRMRKQDRLNRLNSKCALPKLNINSQDRVPKKNYALAYPFGLGLLHQSFLIESTLSTCFHGVCRENS